MSRYIALFVLLAVLVPAAAFAGANEGAAILIGAGAWTKTTDCTTLAKTTCAEVVPTANTTIGANNYFAVYIGREANPPAAMEVTGIDFGIEYTAAIGSVAWNKCGDLEVATTEPLWPASGSGNSMVWTEPEIGNVVLAGWFRVTTYAGYGAMSMQLGQHPTFAACRVLDGGSNLDDLKYPATGTLDGAVGSNPNCVPTSVQTTTWGAIKSQYRD
jgi:hypothetical protein